MRTFVTLLVVGMLGGCGAAGWNPFVQSEKGKAATDTATTEAKNALNASVPPSVSPTTAGADSPVTVILGDKALKELRLALEQTGGATTTRETSINIFSSTTLTLIGIAVGIGLLAVLAVIGWRMFKRTQAYQIAAAAVAPLIVRIKDWQARKAETTDPATLAKANEEIARLNSEKADIEKKLAG